MADTTELPSFYEGKGATEGQDVIAYCRIGERSPHAWFVLQHPVGCENARNYDGSWTEWGSVSGAPTAREVPTVHHAGGDGKVCPPNPSRKAGLP